MMMRVRTITHSSICIFALVLATMPTLRGSHPVCLDPPQIELLGTIAESGPGEMDGAILIQVVVQGVEPYVVLLNGDDWGGPIYGESVIIDGLAAGPYTVQFVGFDGEESNTLDVIVLLNVANDPADIYLGTVLSESAPGAMDGAMTILFASSPDYPPYQILLNGEVYGQTDGDFVISGLSTGTYQVQVVDVDGVPSNILEVFIPLLILDLRVSNLRFEPIIYEAGPDFPPLTHAWITFDMLPGDELHFFNLGITIPANSVYWVLRNVPIPPLINTQTVSYRINIEEFDPTFDLVVCDYHVGPEWYSEPVFPPTMTVELIPMPVTYFVPSGSEETVLLDPFIIPPIIFPPIFPGSFDFHYRGCDVPNIDLDNETYHPADVPVPNDLNACGPAAAGNSLHWLVQQHPELMGDTTSLRSKVDSLKKYMSMAKEDPNGVRFDSMVVGKLTLIDKLMLPIRVKYKTKHASGNTAAPLASLDSTYGHVADNQGALGVYPDFEWYKNEMNDGEDVEVHVGWYGAPDVNGVRERSGGHWLVATGYFEADSTKGVWLKDDADQTMEDSNGLRHEYYEWDTLAGGIPFLRNLTDGEGRIGIVESLVSESYDPNIVFTDVSQYDWSYKPVEYLLTAVTTIDSDHDVTAYLSIMHPVVPEFQFLNLRGINPANGQSGWLVQNLPFAPNATPRPIHYMMHLTDIIGTDTVAPDQIIAELSIGPYVTSADFPYQSALVLDAEPYPYYVGNGLKTLSHNTLTIFPMVPLIPEEPDTTYGMSRECTVPNVDLDSLVSPDPVTGDINACAPAAAANSLRWLMEVHPELAEVDSLRGILDTLKAMMNKDSTGTSWDDIVKGKLEFIDKHQLPIRVKYQVHTPYPHFKPIIPSPDTTYGHAAENKTGPSGFPDFDWLCNELNDGEDVELAITYWCPDSNGMLVQSGGHAVVITGYFKVGDEMWLHWKHDVRQDTAGGMVEEHGRWCVDSLGYPFLKEMNGSGSGCIAYVGAVISESYDPDIVFNDISAYDWMYKPIEYLNGGIHEDPYQAWLVFTLPVDPNARFLNVKMCNPLTGEMHWMLQNVPLVDRSSPMPVRIKIDLRPLITGDTMPTNLIMKYHIGEYQETADFPIQSYAELVAWPALYVIPNGGQIGPHPLIPLLPPIPVTPLPPYIIESIIRGCEVPNIDLDTTMYPVDPMDPATTDWNACGPAAAANSLQWLDDQHEEIDIPVEIRPMLDTLKQMMKLNSNMEGGVNWEDFIKGKLEFIDKYHLPIRVKYQAHASAPAEIPSPNPLYGHKAKNESPPNPDMPGKYLHPTFDWLCQELMEDEDVEMMFGYYCDTIVEVIDTIIADTLEDGTIVFDTLYEFVPKKDRKFGHMINVTGKITIGPLKWITYKHDVYQGGEGGTSPDDAPEGYAYTDISEWIPATGGYVILPRESYIEEDGDECTAYVESIISESYDPEIDFCPEKVCLPEDDGEGTLRRALLCAEDGDTIVIDEMLFNDTITLTSEPLVISKNVYLRGPDGAVDDTPDYWIQGLSVSRVFEILPGVTMTLNGIGIICGDAPDAGCIENAGTLILRDMSFFNHDGMPGTASQIVNTGVLKIEGNTNLKID